MPRIRRIIAGVSGSSRGLPALRWAADLARTYEAELFPVHAWVPPCAVWTGHQFPPEHLCREWEEAAAPPLLPGLIGALVWIASGSTVPGELAEPGSVTTRPAAEMMAWVTLPDSPSGLPTASTTSPTRALAESPNEAGTRPARSSTRITARSLAG